MSGITIAATCDKFGLNADFKEMLIESGWQESLEFFPGVPDFLTLEFARENLPKIKFTDCDLMPYIEEVVEIAKAEPAAQMLAWHLHRTMFLAKKTYNFASMPLPERVFDKNAGVFQLMLALSAIPLIEATHARLGLPEKYSIDAPKWIGGTIPTFQAAHAGIPGHDLRQTAWLRHAIDGRLFRIGRFEYDMSPYAGPIVLQNKKNGQVQALCNDGWTFDAQGQHILPHSPDVVFTASFSDAAGVYSGTPISPYGTVDMQKQSALSAADWEPLVAHCDLVPGMHIPGGERMMLEDAAASLKEAALFFPKYLKREVKLFTCVSWILNPDWETLLPGSNMAGFMKQVYKFPAQLDERPGISGLFFIFGRNDVKPEKCKPQNTIQAVMLDVLKSGGRLKSGGMFILTKDLDKFGTEYYRKAMK